jgi:uncharacterized protein YrzB (UPF0473 family)
MNHGESTITVIDKDGNEQLCEVLFTFDSEEFGKSYVLYFPIVADDEDEEEIEIHASAFIPGEDEEGGQLAEIESEEEWEMVEEMLNAFLDEQEGEE